MSTPAAIVLAPELRLIFARNQRAANGSTREPQRADELRELEIRGLSITRNSAQRFVSPAGRPRANLRHAQ